MKTKACTGCGEDYPLDHYKRHPLTDDGRYHICRECFEDGRPSEHKLTAVDYARIHGVTQEEYELAEEAAGATARYRNWFYKNSGRFGRGGDNQFGGPTADSVVSRSGLHWRRQVVILNLALYLADENGVDMTSRSRRTATMEVA